MIHRALFYGLFLVAVAVLPYLSSQWSKASRSLSNGEGGASNSTDTSQAAAIVPALPRLATSGSPALEGRSGDVPTIDLAEAIRFDVTTTSLYQRWPRVVTGLPEGDLQGYRVPLVTGTREDDVAGSLTYYFNSQQVCQKITLQGSAGDPRKLIAHVVGRFGLKRQPSGDPAVQLYQTRWNGKPVSELAVKPAAVIKASAPNARYGVEMVLKSWAAH